MRRHRSRRHTRRARDQRCDGQLLTYPHRLAEQLCCPRRQRRFRKSCQDSGRQRDLRLGFKGAGVRSDDTRSRRTGELPMSHPLPRSKRLIIYSAIGTYTRFKSEARLRYLMVHRRIVTSSPRSWPSPTTSLPALPHWSTLGQSQPSTWLVPP